MVKHPGWYSALMPKRKAQPETPSIVTIDPAKRVEGTLTLPGDKSISHRYAMLTALSRGRKVHIWNYAPGADCQSTLDVLRLLGVFSERVPTWVATHAKDAPRTNGKTNGTSTATPGIAASADAPPEAPAITAANTAYINIVGRGPRALLEPATWLDCGNSGSTMRMMAGVLAAHGFESLLTGDASLSRRPMRRVAVPLTQMGALVLARQGLPPLDIFGTRLHGINYSPEVPSAQVKSAVLLAGLQAEGRTTVCEPAPTRDHTERAFRTFNIAFQQDGPTIAIDGGQEPFPPERLDVPGDVSSAAFWGCAAAALPDSAIEMTGVGLNPSRTGWLTVLQRAGVDVTVTETHLANGSEPVGTIRVRRGAPRALTVAPGEVPGVIDELPVLAALATFPGFEIHVTGAIELRGKESDRITALVSGLKAMGAQARELPDGFVVKGTEPLKGGATVDACHDHRLAMAFAIATLGAREPVTIKSAEAVAVSYPAFFEVLRRVSQLS
jgi:3-phosphoshikimate 1-carboxyvinyltransferase